MKLRITISKYHSWYLYQISPQIMLLPIQISKALDVLIKNISRRSCSVNNRIIQYLARLTIKCVHKKFYVKSSKNSEYLKRMDPRYPEILSFLELKKFLGKICSLEQFFFTEKSRHSPCSCLKPRSDAKLQYQRFFFNLFSVQEKHLEPAG